MGAELPYNAFGDIKCQFCNAQNHVPIPGAKVDAVGTGEIREDHVDEKKPVNKYLIILVNAVCLIILILVIIMFYAFNPKLAIVMLPVLFVWVILGSKKKR